jgi:hypothetical protein
MSGMKSFPREHDINMLGENVRVKAELVIDDVSGAALFLTSSSDSGLDLDSRIPALLRPQRTD